ncbi:MAG: hypothetical protein VX403_10440 [Planctomycetota bacterium]|nr:hypothetical protein [Planctomycetota bacterium]MEC9234315.1 hypothetical protein [Planctomycetota bacterium]MED6307902.1 hypothetical protein [Planctomycetota bacterium]
MPSPAQTDAFISKDSIVAGFGEAMDRFDVLANPGLLIDTINSFSLVVAVVLTAVGALCLVRGWRWHRAIVLVLALMAGVGVGYALTPTVGRSMVVAIAVGLLCAALAAPMLKWTIAILAGLVGAFVGANAWGILAPEAANEAWAGAGMGFITLALASFILSRLVITFFMSVSGGVLFVAGVLGIMMRIEAVHAPVIEHLQQVPMTVPLLMVVASVIGFVVQRPRLDLQYADAANDDD